MRNTPLLESVLDIFNTAPKPLSVPEILFLLKKKGMDPNKTSLYRMLEKLEKKSLIDSVLIGPKSMHYEKKTHHHYHFQCKDCASVRCIEDKSLAESIKLLLVKLGKEGAMVSEHHFSLSGICKKCS